MLIIYKVQDVLVALSYRWHDVCVFDGLLQSC